MGVKMTKGTNISSSIAVLLILQSLVQAANSAHALLDLAQLLQIRLQPSDRLVASPIGHAKATMHVTPSKTPLEDQQLTLASLVSVQNKDLDTCWRTSRSSKLFHRHPRWQHSAARYVTTENQPTSQELWTKFGWALLNWKQTVWYRYTVIPIQQEYSQR